MQPPDSFFLCSGAISDVSLRGDVLVVILYGLFPLITVQTACCDELKKEACRNASLVVLDQISLEAALFAGYTNHSGCATSVCDTKPAQ